MRSAVPILAAVLCAACGAREQRLPTDAAAGGFSLGSFDGGFDDHLVLPPYFASTLPLTGEEVTREPAGLYTQGDDYYFSYGLLWWAPDVDLSTAALQSDVALYYEGLCRSPTVTATLGDPTASSAGPFADERAGTLTTENCFGAPVPPATLELSTRVCPDHTAVLILVSPQPASSHVWADLHAIRDSFTCW